MSHYAFDRGTFSSLGRTLLQRHSLLHASLIANGNLLRALKDFSLLTACCLHDASNAIHWGLQKHMGPDRAKFLKIMHIVVAACRNSYSLIIRFLPAFLELVIWEDMVYDSDSKRRFYVAFGLEDDVCESLVLLNPQIRGGVLYCNRLWRDTHIDNYLGELANLYIILFTFVTFCDTRWGTLGPCLRIMTIAWHIGLHELISLIVQSGVPLPYLKGYLKLTWEHR